MYDIFKQVISTGLFELTDMLKKIDVQWIHGSITEEERTELVAMAQEHANVQNSIDVLKKLEELDKRMNAMDKEIAALKAPETPEEPGAGEEDVLEDYVPGKWYYGGDRIRFEGEGYTCIAPEGQVCTWNPVEYPAYWQLID